MTQQAPIFDRNLLRKRRLKNKAHHQNYDFLREEALKDINERLSDINRVFDKALNIGSCNIAPQHLPAEKIRNTVYACTSSSECTKPLPNSVLIDDTTLPFKEKSFDLIISNLSMHWINDCQGFLKQIQQLLTPNGLFIANFFGPGTLKELRENISAVETAIKQGISPRISPFIDVKTAGMLLQHTGFDLPVSDSKNYTVSYEDTAHLHEDLKGMNENAAFLQKSPNLNKTLVKELDKRYKKNYPEDDGGIYSTFEIITITGLAKK
jgi:SAM-dependent methyltransferase